MKEGYVDILRCADAIFLEELHRAELYHKTSQAFAVFLPVKSVSVVGDVRRYEYVIALRAVRPAAGHGGLGRCRYGLVLIYTHGTGRQSPRHHAVRQAPLRCVQRRGAGAPTVGSRPRQTCLQADAVPVIRTSVRALRFVVFPFAGHSQST